MQYRALCLAALSEEGTARVCLFQASAKSDIGAGKAIKAVAAHRVTAHGHGHCTAVSVVFHPDDSENCDHESEPENAAETSL